MKILVAIKSVVDHNIKIAITEDGSALELDGLKTSINPFDEHALEEAIRIKDSGKATEVVAVTLGTDANKDILRHALAMGADRAVLVETQEELQSLAVAKLLKVIVEREQPDLILLGKQAIDDDAGQTGQMLAGLLDYPQATFASSIKIHNKDLEVIREVDGGTESIVISLPAVLTTDLRLNQPRFINLSNLMKARKQTIEIQAIQDYEVDVTPRIKIVKFSEPPPRKVGIKVNNIDELLTRLRTNEGISI